MASEFGESVHFSVFGQSHGEGIGIVMDGLPAGEEIDMEEVLEMMRRRAPGHSALSTPRREEDLPEIVSGVWNGKTCGAPFCGIIRNRNTRSGDYQDLLDVPRPGHADYTAGLRHHGFQDWRGGGHFSGRLTAPLCLGGAVCMQILRRRGIDIAAHICRIGSVEERRFDAVAEPLENLRSLGKKVFPVLDDSCGEAMQREILEARRNGDSVGGCVECMAAGFPAGVGSPMFSGIENGLARAIFGIPAVRGLEFGEGFQAAAMHGSEHNDAYCRKEGAVATVTNHHGGILGGISSGMPIVFRVAFKPTPSIGKIQKTLDLKTGEEVELSVHGRHDPCIVQRAVPVVEAVAAMVLLDQLNSEGKL